MNELKKMSHQMFIFYLFLKMMILHGYKFMKEIVLNYHVHYQHECIYFDKNYLNVK